MHEFSNFTFVHSSELTVVNCYEPAMNNNFTKLDLILERLNLVELTWMMQVNYHV